MIYNYCCINTYEVSSYLVYTPCDCQKSVRCTIKSSNIVELTTRDYCESQQSSCEDLVIYYLTPCNLQRSGRGTSNELAHARSIM